MSEINKVVVRYLDGRVLKGMTEDFFPNRPLFHLRPLDSQGTVDVRSRDLKAVFFVRDFAGDPKRHDVRRRLWDLSRAVLPRARVFDFNQALMDFGALVCPARKPRCPTCPMRRSCAAWNQRP